MYDGREEGWRRVQTLTCYTHFSAHSACTVTFAHLHACHTHTHGSSVCKKVFACVSFLSISPSAVSCLTHLLLSLYDSLSLDFPVRTFLPYLPVLNAQGMRISARGREVWLWSTSPARRPEHADGVSQTQSTEELYSPVQSEALREKRVQTKKRLKKAVVSGSRRNGARRA